MAGIIKKLYRFISKIDNSNVACWLRKQFGHNHFHSSWYKNPSGGKSYKQRGNRVDSDNAVYLHTDFYLSGNNNHIIIGKGSRICNCTFMIQGSNNIISVGENTEINNSILRCSGNGSKISIGSNVYIGGAEMFSGSGYSVSIGDGCLFAHNIDIMNDEHPIFEIDSNKRINLPMDILIEENVWIGNGVTVLKGSRVARGSIIGEGATVTYSHSADNNNSIYVGNPLRCVKDNVMWKY